MFRRSIAETPFSSHRQPPEPFPATQTPNSPISLRRQPPRSRLRNPDPKKTQTELHGPSLFVINLTRPFSYNREPRPGGVAPHRPSRSFSPSRRVSRRERHKRDGGTATARLAASHTLPSEVPFTCRLRPRRGVGPRRIDYVPDEAVDIPPPISLLHTPFSTLSCRNPQDDAANCPPPVWQPPHPLSCKLIMPLHCTLMCVL